MDLPYCEVIGCTQTATWMCAIEMDTPHEDFLCDHCRQQWHVECPEHAALYTAYAEAPALPALSVSPQAAHSYSGGNSITIAAKPLPEEKKMNPPPVIRVLVADDHPLTCAGLSAVITRSQGMCIVG